MSVLVISSGLRQLMLCFVSLSRNLRSKKPLEDRNRILSCSLFSLSWQKAGTLQASQKHLWNRVRKPFYFTGCMPFVCAAKIFEMFRNLWHKMMMTYIPPSFYSILMQTYMCNLYVSLHLLLGIQVRLHVFLTFKC